MHIPQKRKCLPEMEIHYPTIIVDERAAMIVTKVSNNGIKLVCYPNKRQLNEITNKRGRRNMNFLRLLVHFVAYRKRIRMCIIYYKYLAIIFTIGKMLITLRRLQFFFYFYDRYR